MTNALSILVVLITACCGIACAEPRAWYVSPIGEDAASGTLDKPLASIQRVQAFAKPGDTVFLRGGVYKLQESQLAEQRGIFGRVIVLNKSGEKGQPITYRAYENEQPVFDFSAIKLSQARVTAF